MTDFNYRSALSLRDAAKAIRDGVEWTPKMVEAVASLLDVAAEDILAAEFRGVSWARWEWTHYCFAVAAQALSEKAQQGVEAAAWGECPNCNNGIRPGDFIHEADGGWWEHDNCDDNEREWIQR